MTTNAQQLKAALRAELQAKLRQMTASQRQAGSLKICDALPQREVWRGAQFILFYAPFGDEPDIRPLISRAQADSKRVALPCLDRLTQSYGARQVRDPATDLTPGKFGILEPRESCEAIPLNRLDFVLVPGVAFDLHGRRLGRGKGYYDRLLPHVRGTTCGIAFDEQIMDVIPVEPQDITVNCILTPTRWIET